MSGDYSRITFDPWQDDLGVLLQQGRPLSDAEWNALALQLRRRIHAGTLDTVGPAVVPMQTPDAFELSFIAGGLGIGRGRIYVDGLLAENHGGGDTTWEPRLEEQVGTQVLSYAPLAGFDAQPYLPNPPALPSGGPHLVYLDVWQREVTHLMRPELVEKAVGVDSTTRLQTVWQVKLLNNVGPDVDCTTPLEQIPGWLPAHAPSAGRLSVTTASVPSEPDPCLIPPGGGYKGLENQLYRVEIHTGGGLGTATFKWSRDNASVESGVTHIPALNQLTVDSTGKDSVLRFNDGDWVEISDDWLELHNQPGHLRRIKIGGGVDDATRTIILDTPLPAGVFPTDAQHRTQPGRHTRIKRWDQRGQIVDQNGNVLQDLAASNGEITVPAGAGVQVLLEHGIVAGFGLDPAGGEFKPGDYWIFAARSVDATVEELDQSPPLGIHHHYAKLGLVTFPGTLINCRVFWPPPMGTVEGDHCACTVCVTPEQHAAGAPSLQMAIDQIRQRGGGTLCLEVGNYRLDAPLDLGGARSLRMVGKGLATQLQATTAAIRVIEARDVRLESFAVVCRPTDDVTNGAIAIASSREVALERLWIGVINENPAWAAIALRGALLDVAVRGCFLEGAFGIRSGDANGGETGLSDLRIDDNGFDCRDVAVSLTGVSVHQFVSRLRGNRVLRCRSAGFELTGIVAPGHGVEIVANTLVVEGDGVRAGIDGLHIVDNRIEQAESDPKQQCGVRLLPVMEGDVAGCSLIGNHIGGFHDAGLELRIPAFDAAMIKQNRFERLARGLLFLGIDRIGRLSIENNQFTDVAGFALAAEAGDVRLAVTGNQIEVRGPAPAVQMQFGAGDCVFSHNHCRRLESGDGADVMLGSDTLIVASNRVQGGRISLDLDVDVRHYTVLGNITRGLILVSGSGLIPPWAPLNMEGI